MSIRKKVVWLPYDMDTAIGINNEGQLVFSYNLEDIDHIEGGADVFNGQESVLWENIRAAFSSELAAMYRQLRSTGALSYAKVEKMFEDHQDKWPEAIFNEDSWFKYIEPLTKDGNGSYLPMMQGSKAEQRKWWLYNRFRYIDSKYNAGDALSDLIQIRGYAKADVTVTPYADIYPSVKYGSYLVQTRGARNTPSTLLCPLDNVNDTEIYIYSASQLASVGDLSGFKVGFADFSMATKLQSIKVGDSDANYDNQNLTALTLGNNVLLKTLDVRNCSGLGTGDQKTVDISGCEIIENVYFDGTAIAGVTLPNGGVLKVLHLPATITNLSILNQKAITDLTVASYANISTLRLENVPTLDTKAILRSVGAGTRVRLIGIAWEAQDATEIDGILDLLDTMRGLDESGNNVETAQVSGTIHTTSLTGAEIASFNSRYPYITVVADYVESTLTYASYDGTTIYKTVTCINGVPQDTAPSDPTREATAQYTYTFVGWSTEMDAQTADASATTNVIADRTVYAAYSRVTSTFTVRWVNNATGGSALLEVDRNVPYSSMPHYDGATPTYSDWIFAGWNPEPSPVVSNITYATKWVRKYDVKFYNGSTLLQSSRVAHNDDAVYTEPFPVTDDVTLDFVGWSRTQDASSPDINALKNITGNTNLYAVFGTAASGNVEIADSWDTIISNIASGNHRYTIGNYKPLDLGANGIVNMQIVGINKDALASGGGKAATTWVSKELLTTAHRMNPGRTGSSGAYTEGTGTIGGWGMCEMRTYCRNTIKPLIPSNVRSAIKEVIKYSRKYNSDVTITADAQTVDDVWIPSARELYGAVASAETSGPIYASAFPDDTSRIKKKTGTSTATWWWTRSAYSTEYYTDVQPGGASGTAIATTDLSIPIGFCM